MRSHRAATSGPGRESGRCLPVRLRDRRRAARDVERPLRDDDVIVHGDQRVRARPSSVAAAARADEDDRPRPAPVTEPSSERASQEPRRRMRRPRRRAVPHARRGRRARAVPRSVARAAARAKARSRDVEPALERVGRERVAEVRPGACAPPTLQSEIATAAGRVARPSSSSRSFTSSAVELASPADSAACSSASSASSSSRARTTSSGPRSGRRPSVDALTSRRRRASQRSRSAACCCEAGACHVSTTARTSALADRGSVRSSSRRTISSSTSLREQLLLERRSGERSASVRRAGPRARSRAWPCTTASPARAPRTRTDRSRRRSRRASHPPRASRPS